VTDKKKVLIVGAGTAGAVILKSLDRHFDVSVLEQSSYKRIPLYFRIPLSIGLLFSRENSYVKKYNFHAESGRLIPFFQSNSLGGASVINGSVHAIGSLKIWKKIFKNFNFDFEDFFTFYNSAFTKSNEKFKIRLKAQSPDEVDENFYQSIKNYSVNKGSSEFFNKPSCGPIWNTVKYFFFRSSVLDLVSKRTKKVRTSSSVDDIEIKDGAVKGVWVGNQFINADLVVLSAGVAGTSRLLCHVLDKLVAEGLTQNTIKDHTNIRINVKSNKPIFCLNQLTLPFIKKIQFIFKNRKKLYSIIRGSGATSAANIDLYGNGEVSLRMNLLRFHESGRLGSTGKLFDSTDFGFSISLTRNVSTSNGQFVSS
jgi:hypothetical protein